MTCEQCEWAKKITRNVVHCVKYGINVRKDYSGCDYQNRRNEHESVDHHWKFDKRS